MMNIPKFTERWGDGGQNQKVILYELNIAKPENAGVRKLTIEGRGITTIITPADGKHWSLAFARLIVKRFQLPERNMERIAITDEMKDLSLHCFAGLPPHHGFVSAFEAGHTMQLTY